MLFASGRSFLTSVRPSSRNTAGFLAVLQPSKKKENKMEKCQCVIALAKGEISLNKARVKQRTISFSKHAPSFCWKPNLPWNGWLLQTFIIYWFFHFYYQRHGREQIHQRNAVNVLPFSLTSDLQLCRVETLQRLEGDCQVGPRFPVLVLFTNRNVFHPPSSFHLHLFTHLVLLSYPLAPLPLERISIYEAPDARQ